MCDHKNIVRLNSGWYCPNCKQCFKEKPEEQKKEEKKKPKSNKGVD